MKKNTVINKLNSLLDNIHMKDFAYRAGYRDAVADCKSIIRKEIIAKTGGTT